MVRHTAKVQSKCAACVLPTHCHFICFIFFNWMLLEFKVKVPKLILCSTDLFYQLQPLVHCALSLGLLYGNINIEANFQKGAWLLFPIIPFLVNGSSASNLCALVHWRLLTHWSTSSLSLIVNPLIFKCTKNWMVLFLYCIKIPQQERKAVEMQQQVCTKSKTKTSSYSKKIKIKPVKKAKNASKLHTLGHPCSFSCNQKN